MPDRRRQRQQRVRHDAGGSQSCSVGASNRDPEPEKPCAVRSHRSAGGGVAYAEPKQYESVTVMPDKEVVEPQKYHRKGVLSNWSRYDEIATDEPEDGEDYQVGEDFSLILEQQANCTGGYLRLKGESSWDEEAGILTSHGLGALHVADLVASINTLPLYTQLNIPEESLPVSVIEFYTQLAEDNRKLYKPSEEYKDCSEVHEKMIQSLLISESEPLTLGSEESETVQSTKNAVDIALSLTEAFAPEPEDVDLNTLLWEQNIEKEASPVHEPSPVNDKKSSRKPTQVKQTGRPDKSRGTTPAKEVTKLEKTLNSAQVIDSAGVTLNKQSMSRNPHTLNNHNDLAKGKDPASFDFGLSKVSTSVSTKGNKGVKDIKDKIAVSNPLKLEESVKEELGAPSVDLDAPLEPSNPVIISKTETENLEDWLDSVLDD